MLNLSKNRFSGTISSLCKISNAFLNLASNNFSGEVTSSLGLLTQLETLSLSKNSFYGLPMKNCSSLSLVDWETIDSLDKYQLGLGRVCHC